MQDFQKKNNKNFNKCIACLRNAKLSRSDETLTQLVNDFDQDPLAIKLLVSYLTYWHDNQLS